MKVYVNEKEHIKNMIYICVLMCASLNDSSNLNHNDNKVRAQNVIIIYMVVGYSQRTK